MCPTCVPGAQEGQKRALDSLELELEMVVRHLMWVLDPLHEQQVLLAAELSFQHIIYFSFLWLLTRTVF